jgi:hypothetical protein
MPADGRSLGQAGLHPSEDGLDTVTPEEAEAVGALPDELLRFTYELADRLGGSTSCTSPLPAGRIGPPVG